MFKPIYNRKGWVLGSCDECGNLDYIEPHGTTAFCKKQRKETEHSNIPYQYRDMSGTQMIRSMPKRSNPNMGLPKGKFFKVNKAKINRDGSVTLAIPDSVMRKANPKRKRNVSEGFFGPDGIFHPIRHSADYDPARGGDSVSKKKKPAKKKKAVKKTTKKKTAKRR